MHDPEPTPATTPTRPPDPVPAPAAKPARTLAHRQILWMTETAILTALIVVLQYTPIGYLPIGPMQISLLTLPVVIGAIVVGPGSGAFLGFVFGLTSFLKCIPLLVAPDPLGTLLFQYDPIYTAVLCFVPRILMGWLVGLIFLALAKIDRTRVVSYAVASVSGALLNTVLFLVTLGLLFGGFDWAPIVKTTVWPFVLAVGVSNGIPEAVVVLLAGTAITKALRVALGDRKRPTPA